MNEVIPGIYRLKLPLKLTDDASVRLTDTAPGYVNAYLVRGDNGHLLVDTGWDTPDSFDSLQKQLAEIGVKVQDISRIVVTHIHPDHYGLVGKLKQLTQAEFVLHQVEYKMIETRYANMERLLRQTAQWLHSNGVPPEELPKLQTSSVGLAKFVVPASPDVKIHGGETITTGISTFQVLWTPGHSPGHICLYEAAKKTLISGDHILPTITSHVGQHPQSGENPLGGYINSLNEIKPLDINLVLPGHENPFTELKPRIDKLIQHHAQRNDKILAGIKIEPKTAYQISRGMVWLSDAGGARWQKLAPFDKRLAVLETLSHLEFMMTNGRVNKFSRNGIIYYQRI